MRESAVERRLRLKCVLRGWDCLKFVSPGHRGVPDRIILMPGGRAVFVEMKAPGETVDPEGLQAYWLKRLTELGFLATSVNSEPAVDALIEKLEAADGV